MTHPRKAIRLAVIEQLKIGVPSVSDRVFKSRAYPMGRQELPAICVYTLTEPNEELTLRGRLERRLALAVDIYARATEAPDDELDDIAEEVEAAMNADRSLGKTCLWHFLAETVIGFAGPAGGGEQANGIARLRYTIRYTTA
jgi:hypothetical protein